MRSSQPLRSPADAKNPSKLPSGPKTFASPEAAASAVYDAAKAENGNALLAIFGPGATDLISSGDPVQDKAAREHFASSYDQMHRWGKLTSGGMVLNVGADNYPFPFPLRKNSAGQWYFDSTEAKDEILVRRIGGNELATIDSLNAMADAQAEYFSDTHDGSKGAITYLQMGADEWRTTDRWPPAGPTNSSAVRELFLRNDRSLQPEKAPPGSDFLSFNFDPAHPVPTVGGHVLSPELQSGPRDQREKVESRPDVLVFTGPAVDKPLEIDGKVQAKLYVSSDRIDTDFTVIMTDVYPDGRSMLIGEGIRRMRLRDSLSKEELITPMDIYPVTIDVPNTALTFLAGHRLRLIVSSSNFPKFALNWNNGGAMYSDGPGVKALNRVYLDRQHPSAIVLPVH